MPLTDTERRILRRRVLGLRRALGEVTARLDRVEAALGDATHPRRPDRRDQPSAGSPDEG